MRRVIVSDVLVAGVVTVDIDTWGQGRSAEGSFYGARGRQVVAKAASTIDGVVVETVSTTNKVVGEAASTAEEIVANATSTTDEVAAETEPTQMRSRRRPRQQQTGW